VLAHSLSGYPHEDEVEIDIFAGIKDVISLRSGVSAPKRLSKPDPVVAQ